MWNPSDDPDKEHVEIANVIALAGIWADSTQSFDHWWTQIEPTDEHPGGLEFKVNGGTYAKQKQRAFIDFQCDRSAKDEDEKRRRDEDEAPKQSSGDLELISYERETEKKTEYETLRLRWKTQYACADYAGSHGDASSGWGFFTWLVIV
jgi:hypothetical protein